MCIGRISSKIRKLASNNAQIDVVWYNVVSVCHGAVRRLTLWSAHVRRIIAACRMISFQYAINKANKARNFRLLSAHLAWSVAIISVFSALSAHKTGLRKSILTAGSLKSRVKAAVTLFCVQLYFYCSKLLTAYKPVYGRLQAIYG